MLTPAEVKISQPSLDEICALAVRSPLATRPMTPATIQEGYAWLVKQAQESLDAIGAKYSSFLLHQLAVHSLDNYCELEKPIFCKLWCGQLRPYNVWTIVDEILFLEWEGLDKKIPFEQRPIGLQLPSVPMTLSKPASMFEKELLHGFWHKHHMQAGFIPFNLRKLLESREGKKLLYKFWMQHYPGDNCTEQEWNVFLKLLSHEMPIGAYETKIAEHYLTGDWIIFAKNGAKNYYFFLATHKDKDEQILECISRLRSEFPFLDSYPQFSHR